MDFCRRRRKEVHREEESVHRGADRLDPQSLGHRGGVAELARKHGVHVNTLRLWRSKYGGLELSDLVRLKQLEEETSRMRRIIATQALEIDAMKELSAKNGWGLHSGKKR